MRSVKRSVFRTAVVLVALFSLYSAEGRTKDAKVEYTGTQRDLCQNDAEKLTMKCGFNSPEEEKKFIIAEGMVPFEVKCDICGESHYQGAGVYPLRKVSGYEIFCCDICYDGNWDGWNQRHEAKLLDHLKKIGVNPPQRNEKGWLPREF